jgi:hypothetical protein
MQLYTLIREDVLPGRGTEPFSGAAGVRATPGRYVVMTAVRTIAALLVLVVLVACSAPPAELFVSVCHAWTDASAPQPAASFDVAVSVDGAAPLAQVPLGECRTLGSYASGTEVTVAGNVPAGFGVAEIRSVARATGAEAVDPRPFALATTFRADDVQVIVFGSAVGVPSTLAISSIVATPGGLPVDPAAIAGSVDVTVTVDPGNDGLQRLTAAVDDGSVVERTFDQAALVAAAMAAGDDPFDLTFTVATDAYEVAGGAATVAFVNGAHTFSASLEPVAGGAAAAVQAEADVTFANADLLLLDVVAGASAVDAGDLTWSGQGLTASFVHVAFGGVAASSFDASFAGLARSTNPAVWTMGDLAGFNSTAAGSMLTVGTTVGGAPGPSAMATVRYDGVAPAVGTGAGLAADFTLTEQLLDGTARCCASNWVSPAYAFADGAPAVSDVVGGVAGVGGVSVTYHAGAAGSSNTELAALPAAATPGAAGLAASAVNTTYSVVARVADALGNVALQRLAPFGANPLATFGVDAGAPTGQVILPGSVLDRTIYNANVPGFGPFAGGAITLNAFDDVLFGSAPVATSFRYTNAADGVTCLVGATTACTPTQQGASFATDNTDVYAGAGAVTEAYFQYQGQAYDAAGNASGTTSVVTYLFDQTAPSVDDIAGVAGTFAAGQSYAFSATATDNVDLKQSAFAFVFPGLTGTNLDAIPLAAPQALGTPWDFENASPSAPVSATVPFVTGVEPTNGAGSPSGVLVPVRQARFLVSDVAENQSSQQTAFTVGTFPPPVSFGAGASPIFPAGATFQQTTSAASLCFESDAPCDAPAVRSVTITATATGPAGTFANPFARVLFAYVDNINVGGSEFTHRFIGIDDTATFVDAGPTRTWTWSATLDAEDLVLNPSGLNYVLPVQAIGISDVTGTALLAVTGTAITVIDN